MISPLFRLLAVVACLCAVQSVYAVKVQFTSEPAGATVQIVGPAEAIERLKVSSGVTPCELDLSRSTAYAIVFSKPGFERIERQINTKETRQVTETLQPLIVE